MEKMYITLNAENRITGLSSSIIEDGIEVMIEVDSDIFFRPFSYRYIDGEFIEDIEFVLRKAKEKKDWELNTACNRAIESGFYHTVNGVEYHFSFDVEAQMNFQQTLFLISTGLISEIVWTVKQEGEYTRIMLTAEDLSGLVISMLQHKEGKISRYRDFLLPIMDGCETVEEVNSITW